MLEVLQLTLSNMNDVYMWIARTDVGSRKLSGGSGKVAAAKLDGGAQLECANVIAPATVISAVTPCSYAVRCCASLNSGRGLLAPLPPVPMVSAPLLLWLLSLQRPLAPPHAPLRPTPR